MPRDSGSPLMYMRGMNWYVHTSMNLHVYIWIFAIAATKPIVGEPRSEAPSASFPSTASIHVLEIYLHCD